MTRVLLFNRSDGVPIKPTYLSISQCMCLSYILPHTAYRDELDVSKKCYSPWAITKSLGKVHGLDQMTQEYVAEGMEVVDNQEQVLKQPDLTPFLFKC